MNRTMMKSKIHRATITGADLDYVGSITLDPELMGLADIQEFEQVPCSTSTTARASRRTRWRAAPGDVILNGAAARLVQPGDRVIVITYARYDEAELAAYAPQIVHVDEAQPTRSPSDEAVERAGSNLVWMREPAPASATLRKLNVGSDP